MKTTKNAINAIHVMRHGSAATEEEFEAESEEMINCTYDVLGDLLPLLLGSTLNLIQHHAQKDKDRAVNAALKDFLAEMDGKTAHDDLEEDLDNATANENKMMEMMKNVAKIASGKTDHQDHRNFAETIFGGRGKPSALQHKTWCKTIKSCRQKIIQEVQRETLRALQPQPQPRV